MSSWTEKSGAEKAKEILFWTMMGIFVYWGGLDITKQREKKALGVDKVYNREVACIEDLETQNTFLEKTGKLFVLPGHGRNQVFALVPVDKYMSNDMQSYIQSCVIVAQRKKITQEQEVVNTPVPKPVYRGQPGQIPQIDEVPQAPKFVGRYVNGKFVKGR